MQIRYSFSSMVLPAADPRSGKRGGSPPEQQGCRPGAEQNARSPSIEACRPSSPGCALSFWLPPLRPRACQGLGPGVRDSPRLLPRRGLSSRNAAFQSQGPREEAPLETALIRSPGREERPSDQDMPGGGRGKKKEISKKLKRMHKSHPLDPPLKPDMNLATPLLRPVCPRLIHQEHTAARAVDADFPNKGSTGSSPRAVNKISCSF